MEDSIIPKDAPEDEEIVDLYSDSLGDKESRLSAKDGQFPKKPTYCGGMYLCILCYYILSPDKMLTKPEIIEKFVLCLRSTVVTSPPNLDLKHAGRGSL